MLSLSKKTDYALLALSHLSRLQERRAANTKEIAEEYDIPVELLAKILQKLAKEGILTSSAGPAGGYRLARPAAEINVGAVIGAVDGPTAIVHCMKSVSSDCEQHTKCTIKTPLARINERVFEVLANITLAEISGMSESAAFVTPLIPTRTYEQTLTLIP